MSDPIQSVAFTIFNKEDGSIRYNGSCAASDLSHQPIPPNSVTIGGTYSDDFCLDLDTYMVKEKGTFSGLPETITLGQEYVVSVPIPTFIRVDGKSPVKIDDGTLELQVFEAGLHSVEVFGPKLKRWIGTLNAS